MFFFSAKNKSAGCTFSPPVSDLGPTEGTSEADKVSGYQWACACESLQST